MEVYPTLLRIPHVSEDILHGIIIPFVPWMQLTSKTLVQQRHRLRLYNIIKKLFLIESIRIKKDIMENYQGGSEYFYDDDNFSLYIRYSFHTNRVLDFLSISF